MLRTSAVIAIVIFSMTAKQACAAPPEGNPSPQHVLVKIQMVEVSRKQLEGLKIQPSTTGDTEGVREIISPRANSVGDAIDVRIFKQTKVLRDFITTLQKHKAAKVVANPSLVVVNGVRASFSCGDNYELPAASGPGKPVQFQSFGTKMDLLATTLPNNNIRLELGVRRTDPDYTRAVNVGNDKLPSMKASHVDTAFEVTSGQSGFFNGLVPVRDPSAMRQAVTKASKNDLVETWFIVTPELMPSVAATQKTVR